MTNYREMKKQREQNSKRLSQATNKQIILIMLLKK